MLQLAEREVNIIIADYNDDFATLRRALVAFEFLERTKDGSVYKRTKLVRKSVVKTL